MRKSLLAIGLTLLMVGSAWADTWTAAASITALQPLVDQEGGVVRVYLSSSISTSACGTTNIFDFVFTNGNAAPNSALVAGLYTALNNNTVVTFLISSTACSPFGAPMITGLNLSAP